MSLSSKKREMEKECTREFLDSCQLREVSVGFDKDESIRVRGKHGIIKTGPLLLNFYFLFFYPLS